MLSNFKTRAFIFILVAAALTNAGIKQITGRSIPAWTTIVVDERKADAVDDKENKSISARNQTVPLLSPVVTDAMKAVPAVKPTVIAAVPAIAKPIAAKAKVAIKQSAKKRHVVRPVKKTVKPPAEAPVVIHPVSDISGSFAHLTGAK